MPASRTVFIAGSTGYMGNRLAAELLRRGHIVSGLARRGSESRLPGACRPVIGDALDGATFSKLVGEVDSYVQLVGVPHPSPAKAQQFRDIDEKSFDESLAVAVANRVRHFVYVSVAHPAPAMHAYIEVRSRCEEKLRRSGLNATILRPWYVLGPGHYWPYALKPFYWLARQIPSTRDGAERLGLVTLEQMVAALVLSVENPASETRILGVSEIAAPALMPSSRPEREARSGGTRS
jgi:uncharacterized protein YbjT (DUF2867 family)